MAIASQIEAYKLMRKQTAWSLLAADTGPETLAYLQALLYDTDRTLPASVFTERLMKLMNEASTESVTREMASSRIVQWRQSGYVVRTLTERDSEPIYELSAGAFEAVRFISQQTVSRISPTESRLELLIHAFKKLVDDTDEDVGKRIARLKQEKKAIDERIRALREGRIGTVSDVEVQSQVFDILAMIEALDGDFLRVRDAFHALSERIHEDVMGSDATRGAILEQFFAGYDSIAESDEGRTFTAFYKFLSSEMATREIEELVDSLTERPFWGDLEERRQEAIAEVQNNLNMRARETQRVMKRLAASLRYFVQSREYQQNRRLAELIEQTRKLSLQAYRAQAVSTYSNLVQTDQSFISISSIGAVSLYDPQNAGQAQTLEPAAVAAIDLQALAERLSASEINYAQLRRNIEACLQTQSAVSIGDVLERFAATQGLASVIGYIHLAIEHAEAPVPGAFEWVQWSDRFDTLKKGRLPRYVFVRGCMQPHASAKTTSQ